MSWITQHVGMTGAAGGGTAAILALAFKDVFREWWRDYRAERQAEKSKHGQNGNVQLAHELLAILRQDLQENRGQIKDLTTVLGKLTSAIEHLGSITDSSHKLLSETRDNVIELKGRLS